MENKTRYLKAFALIIALIVSTNVLSINHPSSGTTTGTVNCGTTYNYFDPGGAGGNYGNNQLGTLVLNPSVGGQYVSIDFTVGPFDIEPNGAGCWDWISIYDGPNTGSPLIGTYCNSNVPGVITSSTGSLTVVFDSDGFTTGTGWVAQISCSATPGPPPPLIHPSSGTSSTTVTCGSTTTYYDPGGTGSYGNNQLGTLTINPSVGGSMVQIDFGAGPFDIEPNGAGCWDWISIYDGPNTGSPLIGTYCNSNIPGIITSTTGPLTIVFDSDGFTTGTGWVANITCFTPCGIAGGTASASPSALCPLASGNTTLSLTGEDPAATIQWQVSTNGGTTWTNIAGATTDPWVQFLNTNSMYQALVTNGCTSTSSSIAVTVGCPPIIQPSGSGNDQSFTVGCGGSYNYYDEGGAGGNYTDNETTMMTICPATPGQYVSVNFTSFNLENNEDFMYVFDGDDGSANIIGVYTGTLTGTVTASSANPSGCLSFRFMSDNGTVAAGWQATVTCTGTPAAPYPTPGIEDCNGSVTICSNSTLSGGTNSYGNFQELPPAWNYCINPDEHQSNWYVFSPQTSGTIGFQITPASPTDYDWAIWGPYNQLECPAFTNDPPIRCSSTQLLGNGNTGLVAPANDTIEQNGEYAACCGSIDDGFLKPMDVLAGEIYVMMIDNWDNNSVNFDLNWNLTNGATLDCTPPLPVELSYFEAQCDNSNTVLKWTTETEVNNNFFIVEKSDESFNFKEIGKVFGVGTSNSPNHYSFIDTEINEKTAYYRLMQVDFDGSVEYHRIVASNCFNHAFDVPITNLTSNNLDLLITSGTNELLTICLYNSVGKLITKEVKEINAGNNSIKLKNFNISNGIYLLSINGEYHAYSSKLIRK